MKILFMTEQPELALRFRDYVKQQYQCELVFYQKGEQAVLALDKNDPQLTAILAELNIYCQNPTAEQYTQASWQNGQVDSFQRLFVHGLPHISFRHIFSQTPITALITALCIIVYLISLVGDHNMVYWLAHFPEHSGQYIEFWRFFSHSLVHLSLTHIIFNLTYWLVFAAMIERQQGSYKVISLFLSIALVSGVVQNTFSGAAFFGLSGVVYGILGYVYVMNRFDQRQRFPLPSGFIYMLLIGVGIGFFGPVVDIHFGNAAHISGLFSGAVFAWLGIRYKKFKV